MAARRTLWVPVVLGLATALLYGMTGGSVTAAEPRVTTASIMISAAAFSPIFDDVDYINDGSEVSTASSAGPVVKAPLTFPVPEVTIKRITLYAYDNGTGSACVILERSRPAGAAYVRQGSACTVDSASDPQVATTTAISPRTVDTSVHGSYLRLMLSPGMRVYGVKVTYSYQTAG